MKKYLVIFLIILPSFVSGQNNDLLHFEKVAIDYFSDTICKKFTKSKIYYDGKIYNKRIDSTYVDYLINCFFTFRRNGITDIKIKNQKYFELYNKYNDEFQLSKKSNSIDSIDYSNTRLKFKKPIKARKDLKYKISKGGSFRYHWKKIKGFFFKEKFNIDLTRSIKIGNYNWVRIRLDRPDREYGIIYLILITDNGEIFDYSLATWM